MWKPSIKTGKMWGRLFGIVALVALLDSCVTLDQETGDTLSAQYRGRNADDFFLQHGAPASRHQLNSGETLFTWDSGVTVFDKMQTVTTTTKPSKSGSQSGKTLSTATSMGNGTLTTQCVIQILAASDGIIRNIKVIKSTEGHWNLSRCNELLL